MRGRTELEDDSSKEDAFIGCIFWKIIAFVDHTINTIFPCCDVTKVGALWTERQ
jgi:hypothetical protein